MDEQQPAERTAHRFIKGDALTALDEIPDKSCRLAITSPPYNIGKEYERSEKRTLESYVEWLDPIIEKMCAKVRLDGHICWQVGNYVNDGEVFPLDYFFYQKFIDQGLKLRNRIIWHFNFGLHATKRFSGRYETLLWFSRGDDYHFNLEPVLIPQLYPGKRHSKNRKSKPGQLSGNPKGKNPSDFWTFLPEVELKQSGTWEIPNVKANHPEKTTHPCQFPVELVERCILALTVEGDQVLDPFVGTGTSVIAAAKHGRIGIGIDKSEEYVALAQERLRAFQQGELPVRDIGRQVHRPKGTEKVAAFPEEWKLAAE